MLPKIPFINEKDKAKLQNGGGSGGINGTSATPLSPGKSAGGSSPAPESGSASNSHSLANPMVWTQDIIHSYETPLASETYELPDNDSLNARMLGISLEHGLLHGIDNGTTDIMIAGLEHYLKEIIQQIFDKSRYRKVPNGSIFDGSNNRPSNGLGSSVGGALGGSVGPSFDDIMAVEDMALTLETSPHCFVEMSGPVYKLQNVMLKDEESALDSEQAPIAAFNPYIESQPEIANLLRDIMSG